MNATSSRSVRSRQGFTLVEVLVSSFLTLMVMGMLFSVLIGTINAWEGGTSKLETSGDVRLALDILKSDLEGLVVRQTQYNQEWISSRPFQISGTPFNNTWLSFFSPSLDREPGQQGDIVAVSYAVAFRDPISPTSNHAPIFGLYKCMTSTAYAFNTALGNDPLTEKFGSSAFWPGDNNGPDFSWNDTNDVFKDLIAPHVVRFAVTWLVRQPNASSLTRVNEANFVRLNNSLEIGGSSGGKIEAAEISITTINDEAMERFNFFKGTSQAGGQLNTLIEEFGTTHTIRVPITY